MEVQLKNWMGGGTQGDVWTTQTGDVVKFTTSKAEVITCDRLRHVQQRGFALPHFPQILAISKTKKGFAILRGDVPDIILSPSVKDDLYIFQTGWSYEDETRLRDTTGRSPQLGPLYKDLETFRQLTKIRICDLDHDGNLGGHPDHLIIRDLGLVTGVDYALFEHIIWDEMTFTEPAPDDETFSL